MQAFSGDARVPLNVGYAWFNFTCYHPPGQPRGQVQPFSPGGGELFEAVLSRG